MDASDWYIEVNGKKVGPFTLDQIQGFFQDGEIRAYHQVTSKQLGGQWISVEELIQTQTPPAVIPEVERTQLTGINFQPPPRPEISPSEPIEDKVDPTMSLFNALQVVREKRAATIEPATYKNKGLRKPLFKVMDMSANFAAVRAALPAVRAAIPITPRMWWTAVSAGLILGALTFGIMKGFKHRAQSGPGSLTQVTGALPLTTTTVTNPFNSGVNSGIGSVPNKPKSSFPEAAKHLIPPPQPPPHMSSLNSGRRGGGAMIPRPGEENQGQNAQDNGAQYPPPDPSNPYNTPNGNYAGEPAGYPPAQQPPVQQNFEPQNGQTPGYPPNSQNLPYPQTPQTMQNGQNPTYVPVDPNTGAPIQNPPNQTETEQNAAPSQDQFQQQQQLLQQQQQQQPPQQ
jgi:hypothetical protein